MLIQFKWHSSSLKKVMVIGSKKKSVRTKKQKFQLGLGLISNPSLSLERARKMLQNQRTI